MPTCENCTHTHDGSYASGRFCTPKCSRSFSSKISFRKDPEKYKVKANCTFCGGELLVDKRTNLKNVYHKKCKNDRRNQKRTCKCCGQTPCKKPTICKNNIKIIRSLKKDGIIKQFGNKKIYKEVEQLINKLNYLYYKKELSGFEIAKKLGIKNYFRGNHFTLIMKRLGIKPRSRSDSQYIAKKTGRHVVRNSGSKYVYKHGWHTTWNGNEIFYRSSYELNMCNYLDSKRIKYKVEGLRIPYKDSQLNKTRISIVDFFLPDHNLIIEVKSNWTLDPINMKDRRRAYKKGGYKFKLLLNNKDYDLDKGRYYKRKKGIV
jgi:hypothetical protein